MLDKLKRRRHEKEYLCPEDEVTGRVVRSGISDDGTRLEYMLSMSDGTERTFAVPTRSLDVMFTASGLVELSSDEDN